MKNNDKYLIFFPVCMIVRGYERSVILDIQRAILDFIPNELYDLYNKYNKLKISEILPNYNQGEQEIVMEYIDFLLKNEYAFLGTKHDAEHISDISLKYNYFGKMTNCILEYSDFTEKNMQHILSIVDNKLGYSALQIIIKEQISKNSLSQFLKIFQGITFLNHIEIVMPYMPDFSENKIKPFLFENLLLNRLIIYSAPFDKVIDMKHTFVVYLQKNINDNVCGIVDKAYFTQNVYHITEAINYNTCLNKKFFINKNGNIKNCPFSSNVFGNIMNDDIEKIISNHSFTKYWFIKKDEIEVCRDCEFRYICTDCRVFLKKSDNLHSQPLHCKYNPYIAKWEGEKGYISVEEWYKNVKY
jgi:SPASM domain peptide maturase of grasp-with-spasm system